jgi:hypothetical protein
LSVSLQMWGFILGAFLHFVGWLRPTSPPHRLSVTETLGVLHMHMGWTVYNAQRKRVTVYKLLVLHRTWVFGV